MALAITSLSDMWDCIPQSLYSVTSALGEIIYTDVRPLGDSVLIQVLFSALYTKLLETAKNCSPEEEPRATESGPETPSSMSKSSVCMMLAEASCCIDEDNKHTDAINNLIKQAKQRQNVEDTELLEPAQYSLGEGQSELVSTKSYMRYNETFLSNIFIS